jgi:uncharacterized SAM-binding protein YcdF (DUF218 family)
VSRQFREEESYLKSVTHKLPVKRSLFKRFCYWLVALFLLALIVAVVFARSLLLVENRVRPAQLVILLGGGPDDRPPRALELLRAGLAPRVLLSGDGEQQYALAKLREAKIPNVRIMLETESTSTKENAEFTVRILRAQKITNAIVVTSWPHSRRALACFRDAAPEIDFQSAPAQPSQTNYGIPAPRDAAFALREYLKIVWYAFRWRVFPWDA